MGLWEGEGFASVEAGMEQQVSECFSLSSATACVARCDTSGNHTFGFLLCRQQEVDVAAAAAAAAIRPKNNLARLPDCCSACKICRRRKKTLPPLLLRVFPIRMMQMQLDMRRHVVRPLRVAAPWWPRLSITLRNKSIKSSRTN